MGGRHERYVTCMRRDSKSAGVRASVGMEVKGIVARNGPTCDKCMSWDRPPACCMPGPSHRAELTERLDPGDGAGTGNQRAAVLVVPPRLTLEHDTIPMSGSERVSEHTFLHGLRLYSQSVLWRSRVCHRVKTIAVPNKSERPVGALEAVKTRR